MSAKRLHIHSLPLIALAVVVTTVSALSVQSSLTASSSNITHALLRPGIRLESTNSGYVKVTPNQPKAAEPAGASVDVNGPDNSAVMRATEAVQSIGLRLALQPAIK